MKCVLLSIKCMRWYLESRRNFVVFSDGSIFLMKGNYSYVVIHHEVSSKQYQPQNNKLLQKDLWPHFPHKLISHLWISKEGSRFSSVFKVTQIGVVFDISEIFLRIFPQAILILVWCEPELRATQQSGIAIAIWLKIKISVKSAALIIPRELLDPIIDFTVC